MAQRTIGIHALFSLNGIDHNPHFNCSVLYRADVITAVDVDSQAEVVLFGRDVEPCFETEVLSIELDFDDWHERSIIVEVIRFLRGRCDASANDLAVARNQA